MDIDGWKFRFRRDKSDYEELIDKTGKLNGYFK